MSQIRLRIVGESVIEVGETSITPTSPQLFALLLYLGVEHNREVPRAELLALLYPASDPIREASHRLRQSLYKLKVIGSPLTFGDGTLRVDGASVQSTLSVLLNGTWESRKLHLSHSFEVLPHYAPTVNTPFSHWVEHLRDRLHNALRQQLTRDFEVARYMADWRHLEALARRTLELDPLNESAILGLAEATAHTGSKALAMSILDAYRSDLGETHSNLVLPAALLQRRIHASRERATTARRTAIPLIGRERESASLLSQWQSSRRGEAHILWLTGNKSIGKSRLADELASTALISGSGRVVSFAMSPLDADRPLSLFAALADRLSALPGAAGCDPSSLQALGKLSGSISIPSAVNPENTNSTYSDAVVRSALCDLIACVSDERPILAIVDNAQYLDEASAHLLDALIGRVADKRFLIVLCGLDERFAVCHRHSTLHLEPLSAAASFDLWQTLLSTQESRLPDDISRKCLDTAAGNPGHLELLAQQVAHGAEHFVIPADLIGLTDRRLSELSRQARYVLEALVILNDVATAISVAYVTGLSASEMMTALHTLESSDLILNTHSGLKCRSGLIAERVRDTSSRAVSSMMEARAAEYIEKEQHGERWSPSTAWRIASHWQRAGEPRRARAYLRACWQHAVSIGQPARASTAISEALATTSDPEDRASLLDDLIGSLQATADLKGVIPALNERRSLSSRVHDTPARIAQLSFDEDEANLVKNSNPAAHMAALRTHLESSLLNSQRRIRAARLLMMAADGDLNPSLATYAMSRCQKLCPEDPHSVLLLSHVLLIYHTIFGNADQALKLADDIQEQTGGLERSWYTVMSDRNCAFARQLAGPGPLDYASFERGFAQAIDASMTVTALGHAGSLMSVYIDDGDLDCAQAWQATAERLAESIDPADLPIDYLGAQVDLSLLTGNLKKAAQYFERMEHCAPRYQSVRSRNDLFIYRLRVQIFAGGLTTPADHVESLLRYHEIAKGLTRHDDHMDVLWETLNAVGDSDRASALLLDYLQYHRRERSPCRYFLRFRTENDPAWDLITPSSGASVKAAR
jgi:DNA-binding SARP family transcriptional activator